MGKHKMVEGFWDRVDEAVKKSGLTRAEIARRGNFTRDVFYESTKMFSSGTLASFCSVTHVSADWLLGVKREMTKEEKESALIVNLKGWDFTANPFFKIEKDEADIIIEALEIKKANEMLNRISSIQ